MSAIAPPRLQIPESIEFAHWEARYDQRLLEDDREPTNALALERIGSRNHTTGLRVCGPIARGVLADSDAVALIGGDALVDWVLNDARAPAVRVLAFDADTDTSRLASAPFLAQVRRLILQGKSALASPWLGPLESLILIRPARLDAVAITPRLRELSITGTARDHTLDAMHRLLYGTQLERVKLSELEVPLDALELAHLKRLELVDCALRGTELLAAMPALECFTGTRCGLDDDAAFALARSPALYILGLGGNDLTDAGVAAIAKLSKLRSLDLSATAITDAGAASLVGLRELRWLSLAKTAITDAGVIALAQLQSGWGTLTLDLSSTAVSDIGAAALKARHANLSLDLRGTKATAASRDERGFVVV